MKLGLERSPDPGCLRWRKGSLGPGYQREAGAGSQGKEGLLLHEFLCIRPLVKDK
jgi:hypothetical protein